MAVVYAFAIIGAAVVVGLLALLGHILATDDPDRTTCIYDQECFCNDCRPDDH